MINTPSPLVPQGTLPARGKSIYFKVLMVLSIHVVVIGGMLMLGCKDTTKESPGNTPPPSTGDTTSASNVDTNTIQSPSSPSNLSTIPQPGPQPVQQPAPMPPPSYTSNAAPTANTSPGGEYVIVHGDTLAAIAHKNGFSLKALEAANPGVNPKKLHVGQKLQLPEGGASPSTGAGTSGMDAANAVDEMAYTVKSGDSLTRIAHAHHTTVKKIMALNDLKTTGIRAGQKLKLPAARSEGEAGMTPSSAPAQPLGAPGLNSNSGPVNPEPAPTK